MDTFTISLNLLKFKNAGTANIKDRSGDTKKCVVIPLDDNPELFQGNSGLYLNLIAFAKTEADQYGNTHMVKGNLPKDMREKMTKDERFAQPILGNMKPLNTAGIDYSNSLDPGDLPY